jgi:hypothetical protein
MSSDGPINQARLQGAARNLTRGGLIAVTWAGFALACGFVLLRCHVRLTESRRLYSDDYWLLAALFFLGLNAILQTLQAPSLYYLIYASSGEAPAGETLIDQGNIYVRYQFVIILLFFTIIWSVKYSFLALYYRLFKGLSTYRRVWWVVVCFAAMAYIGCWITSIWTCHPPSTYFDFGNPLLSLKHADGSVLIWPGQCAKPIDLEGSVISISYSTAVDVLTDLMIMVLPYKLLVSLRVSKVQRFALVGIFSVGCIVIACSLIRLTQIVAHARSDPVGLAVWGIVESSMSVVVGSLPALKSYFGRAWDRTVMRYSGQLGSSDLQWSGRALGPGRVALSDPETSWRSFNTIPTHTSEPGASQDLWVTRDRSLTSSAKALPVYTSELSASQDSRDSRDRSPTKKSYSVEEYERVLRSLSDADPGLELPDTAAELAAIAKAHPRSAPNG